MNAALQNLTIVSLDTVGVERWDAFVESCPEASFFHRAGWRRIMEEVFGHRTHFLAAEREGVIEGILPLAHMKSLLFGNRLASLPFCVYGGVAAIGDGARQALFAEAVRLAGDLRVASIEFKHERRQHPDWPVKDDLYFTFRKTMADDDDAILQAIPRKQRAMVRKGIKAGLTLEIVDDADLVYALYAQSVRNLGTPVFSRKLFPKLVEVFGDACELALVRHEGKPVASVLSFYFRDQVLPYYAGSIPEARALKAHDFMYWKLMCHARATHDARVFDFGRSKAGTGPFSFKKNWGFEPTPLHYEYWLKPGESLPDLNPSNPKYRLVIDTWKKLPLPIANRLGPMLSRHLG